MRQLFFYLPAKFFYIRDVNTQYYASLIYPFYCD